jgi:hypothetical protein
VKRNSCSSIRSSLSARFGKGGFRRRVAALLALVTSAAACGNTARGETSLTRDACVHVEVQGRRDNMLLIFSRRGYEPRPAFVSAVYTVADDGTEDGRLLCVIESGAKRASQWRYGTIPEGYRSRGSCGLLPPGRYDVTVFGDGRGFVTFDVRADGSVVALSSMC